MKRLLRFLLRVVFGFRAHGCEHLHASGPVLLTPNHVSWIDWLFLLAVLDDDWKFVTSSTTAQTSWIHRRLMLNHRTFPVDNTSAYAVRDMAAFLHDGGKLVLFPEGRLSRTGRLMKLYDGTGFLIHKTGARVITCYLRGCERLPWVKHPGRTQWFPRISAHFSAPSQPSLPENISGANARRLSTLWLQDSMRAQQFTVEMALGPANLAAAIGATLAAAPAAIALEDFTGSLTFRRLAVASDLLASAWTRRFGPAPQERIGVLLPTANATPLCLLSLWSINKVPAILNFSSGPAVMLDCARLAQVQHVITSRRFLEKAKLDLSTWSESGIQVHFLEDVRAALPLLAKLRSVLGDRIHTGGRLQRSLARSDDAAVILFTSGSEGLPKGVELSHRNLLANARQLDASLDVTDHDRFFNALPVFHSFGLLGGVLFPLIRGCYAYQYPSPLHYRVVPTLVYEKSCTVLMGTNTFLNGYARKAHPYDFTTLRYLVAGAEKVQPANFDTWARKFGVRILEGYGATECSPVISVNDLVENSVGSAGRLLPGIDYRLEPVTGVDVGGRLFVRGPNIMKGYLNPAANSAFRSLDGWYDTGDIVSIDSEGFLHILGRLKRFAKVSGEMVSLGAVEEALAQALIPANSRTQIAILAVPDAEKGEKLVAATNDPRIQLADLRNALRTRGLSNLCAPRELHHLPSVPKLGTGKTDYRALQASLHAKPVAAVPS